MWAVNSAQTALLARLREIIEETPKSGALDAGKRPLRVTRFQQAVERRADDGDALVAYARAKIWESVTSGYSALVDAGRSDLTVEAVVADANGPWASEFTDEDRTAAQGRLDDMIEEHREAQEPAEAEAVARDRKIVAQVSARRIAKGKPALTQEQEADMLKKLVAERAATG